MQFRLLYDGRLPTQSTQNTRAKEKHEIRRQLHPQLAALWRTHPFLSRHLECVLDDPEVSGNKIRHVDSIGRQYARCGHHFVPLVCDLFGSGPRTLACALDILFLRADHPPGDLIKDGGDIDNRIKVLFDALQIPKNCSGIPGDPPPGEDPFYCLLEDDSLITEVKITTDRLLEPPASGVPVSHPEQAVHLVIHVRTQVLGASGYTAFMT